MARGESVMAHRWAVGLSLGSMSLVRDGQSDTETQFGIGELALRFRATRRLELEASAGGGRERLHDGADGDLVVGMAALAARFRFNPEGRWNWFVMGGVGAAAVVRHDASDQEVDDATRPLGMLGVGLERRFHHFAFQAEARVVGIGDDEHDDKMTDAPPASAYAVTTTSSNRQALGGGSVSLGVSYYF